MLASPNLIAWEPKEKAPGFEAVLADRLAKLVVDDGEEDDPNVKVGEAFADDDCEPNDDPNAAGCVLAPVEAPNENAGVAGEDAVAVLLEEPNPPNADAPSLLEFDDERALPKVNVGAVLEVEEAAVVVSAGFAKEKPGAAAGGAVVEVDANLLLSLEKLTGLPPNEKPPAFVDRSSFGAPGMLRVASAFCLSSSDTLLLTGLPPKEKPPVGSENEGGLTGEAEAEVEAVLDPVTTISSSSSSSSSSAPPSSS